jgi:coenzyme F420 hydrogenase subunit beta
MCPVNAINMVVDRDKGVYRTVVDSKKCVGCGVCYKVCPGHSVDFEELNKVLFDRQAQSSVLGSYLSCFSGYSTDNNLRYDSSSGGLVTQLLISALERGIIDGALITVMDDGNPLRPHSFIARTQEEIISSVGAKYCPVPVNIMLKEILNTQEGQKFAIVGMPCQIQGIRKAELVNKYLKKKIVLHLGLFCTHGISFLGTLAALKERGIKEDQVQSIKYRFGDFPPGKTLIRSNNEDRIINHLEFWNALLSIGIDAIPARCRMCIDQTSELADISIGSGWFAYKINNQINYSVGVIRNTVGKAFIQEIKSANKIDIFPVDPGALALFEKTQRGDKKNKYQYLLFFLKLFAKKYPVYRSKLLKSEIKMNLKLWLKALNFYLMGCVNIKEKE